MFALKGHFKLNTSIEYGARNLESSPDIHSEKGKIHEEAVEVALLCCATFRWIYDAAMTDQTFWDAKKIIIVFTWFIPY